MSTEVVAQFQRFFLRFKTETMINSHVIYLAGLLFILQIMQFGGGRIPEIARASAVSVSRFMAAALINIQNKISIIADTWAWRDQSGIAARFLVGAPVSPDTAEALQAAIPVIAA